MKKMSKERHKREEGRPEKEREEEEKENRRGKKRKKTIDSVLEISAHTCSHLELPVSQTVLWPLGGSSGPRLRISASSHS